MKKLSQRRSNRARTAAILCVVALLLAGSWSVWAYQNRQNDDQKTHQTTSQTDQINLNQPTKDQTDAQTEITKPAKDGQDDQAGQTADGRKQATITVDPVKYSDQAVQIRAAISVIEADGTCKLTLTKTGFDSVTASAGTQAFASYSLCKGFDIPKSKLGNGQWQLKLDYSSAKSYGVVNKTIQLEGL